MNVKALEIRMGNMRVGLLYQSISEGSPEINRFIVDDAFIGLAHPPRVSMAFAVSSAADQAALWRDIYSTPFNGALSKDGRSWFLPAFFQNLLPEGAFRTHIAELRGCKPSDHFELLAACGRDLPGNVLALPANLAAEDIARFVTQGNDALEMTVSEQPLEEGMSLSGVQPKMGVNLVAGRYVARTKDQDTHIIAKLPVASHPLLPEVEDLSLRLAAAAGVHACKASLEPLEKLAASHAYDLGDATAQTSFLAVVRYDRGSAARVHCEDFAQILGVMPEDKYTRQQSYLGIAATLLAMPSLGEPAVHELLRRIKVNELLGNADMHLKNVGLFYPDGSTPELPPAYDIVAHAAFQHVRGHGLHILPAAMEATVRPSGDDAHQKLQLTPAVLRRFCERLGIPEKPAAKVLSDCVKAAWASWPGMIAGSKLTTAQKERLSAHFTGHPDVQSLMRRSTKTRA